jgi:L-lactate dehydrogenase complex protein LldG
VADEQSVERFLREAAAVQANAVRVSRDEMVECLVGLLRDHRSVVAAAGLEAIVTELQSRGVKIVCDDGSDSAGAALLGADAGLSQALAGVAASGTVLTGPGLGIEGFASILPPHHVVLLQASRIEPDLETVLASAAPLVAEPGSRFVFITGPSRTSDIELTPVIGVHGPLRLDVVVIDG